MADQKKKILILLSDTGGGHRASAGAVTEGLVKVYGEDVFEFVVLDIWTEYGNWPFNSFVSVYRFASENPWCWRWMYESSKSPISRSLFLASGYAVSGINIKKVVLKINPHLIISVHPLCQHIILQVLKELREEASCESATYSGGGERNLNNSIWRMPPFVTVVTDLGGAHPTWFHPKATRVYVPSTNILQTARLEGVAESRIKHFGLPLRKPFWTKIVGLSAFEILPNEINNTSLASGYTNNSYYEQEFKDRIDAAQREARTKLGLELDYPTCLIVGGGEGVGSIDQVSEGIVLWALKTSAQAYAEFKVQEGNIISELQVLVVCGKNEKTRQKVIKTLNAIKESNPQASVTIEDKSAAYDGPGAVNQKNERGTDYNHPKQNSNATTNNDRAKNCSQQGERSSQAAVRPANTFLSHNTEVKIPLITSAQFTESLPDGATARTIMMRTRVLPKSPPRDKLEEAARASNVPVEDLIHEVDIIRQDSIKKEDARLTELDEQVKASIQAVNPFDCKNDTELPKQTAPRKCIPKLDTANLAPARKNSVTANVKVVVYGFADNIDELMTAASLIVTKAGPGTIAEATTRALPVLLSSYMPGQEEGNVSYVLNNKFGTYSEKPDQIGLIVREWLLNPRFEIKLNNMRYRSLRCANPMASIDIARDMGRLIGLSPAL